VTTDRAHPIETVEFEVDGLARPVEILVDEFGVPHIYAESAADLFLAQGFDAARARLFQMDVWRRRGLGLLAAAFGEAFVERDRASRSLLYRGEATRAWEALGEATASACASFVAGVNAYVTLTRQRVDLRPPEFEALGFEPSVWESDDLVRIRIPTVASNAMSEIFRATTVRDFGRDVAEAWSGKVPASPLDIPEGLDVELLPDGLDRRYLESVATGASGLDLGGSNAWVVSGDRTATGRPILAADPHRDSASLPGVRYVTHLVCPDFDVIGAGEPHSPGVALGHNAHVAFGFTLFFVDQEDLYLYELDEADPTRYRYGDGWEPVRVVRERIPVRGSEPREVDLLFTRHGPVLARDERRGSLVALRAAWLEPGAAPYLASVGYLGARDATEFLAALRAWASPGENHVYADTAGNIGWTQSGLAPRRVGWDGSMPAPGDGRYEWDGFFDSAELPGEHDPPRGFVATANQYAIPAGHPLTGRLGVDWPGPQRKQRIDEILASEESATVAGMARLQLDVLDRRALDIVRDLDRLMRGQRLPDLMAEMFVWDGRMAAESRAALLFEVWVLRRLLPAMLQIRLRRDGVADPAGLAAHLGAFGADASRAFELLRVGNERLRAEVRGATLATFEQALDESSRRLGPDPATWTWGALSHSQPRHPFARRLAGSWPEDWVECGRTPRPGAAETVGLNRFDADHRNVVGASFRMVLDVGEWDRSIAMNAPGQSGDPRDPHYRDLYDSWAAGDSFPLLYSRAAVEAAAELRIVLRPS
jgi:penicillin amidase